MNAEREHPPTLKDAYERLAARDTGGGDPDHELESERERILSEAEDPQTVGRWRFERLYRSAEAEGGYRTSTVRLLIVLIALGLVLGLLYWLLGAPAY